MELPLKQRALRWVGHLDWLRGRDRILRAFSDPDRQSSFPFEVEDSFGHSYSGNLNNFIDWMTFYYGSFAREELRLLAALAKAIRAQGKPVNFFDVGANIGNHTVFTAHCADHVYAFEPFALVRDELERKVSHAKLHNVSVFPVALGEANESLPYHPPTGANQGTGSLVDTSEHQDDGETIMVDVVRGDDFFAGNHLPPISLLKMDVEGFEVQALRGMRETLLRDRPPILMEIFVQATSDLEVSKEANVRDWLYPDHLLLEVLNVRTHFRLRPFSNKRKTEQVLVLPRELEGIISGLQSL